MKNSKFVFAVFFAVILCLPNLSSGEDFGSLVRGNTEFALELYSKLKQEKGNIFFSPYSISAATGMVYAGARGETEEQMAKTLRFSSDQQHVHPAFAKIFASMNAKMNESQKKNDEEQDAAHEKWYATAALCAALEEEYEPWYIKWFAGKSEPLKNAALEKWCAIFKKEYDPRYSKWLGLAGKNESLKSESLKLSFANSLWPQQDYKLSDDYLALTKKHYGVSVTPVDYQRAAEKARKQINEWVSDKTENKINDIIQPGTFDNLTRLILVNAVYFKGAWKNPFEERKTKDSPFHLSASKSVKVPMMTQRKYLNYVDTGDGLQILELPYVGSDISMLVLLPKEIDGLEQIESRLSFESLKNRRKSLENSEVIVFLPKFRMTSAFGLNAVLQKMGMVDAFDMEKADFAGMNGNNCRDDKLSCLHIKAVIHKAYADVNEEGTEATAATAAWLVKGEGSSRYYTPPPPVFRADHPFLFLIQERQTGSILFMGRVTDPSKAVE